MAGPNQHYLPQFAQRPFKTNEPGNRAKVFRYQHGRPPERSRRINITGAEDFFYSDNTPSTTASLDERITALENELSMIHQRLSAQNSGPVSSPEEAIRLVQHLGMRTKALRDVLMDGISEAISSFAEVIARPGFFQDLLTAKRKELETKVQTRIEDPNIIGANMEIASPQAVSPIISYAIREALAHRLDEIGTALTDQFRPILDIGSDQATEHHQEALLSTIKNPILPERLLALNWSVLVDDFGDGLILPDSATVTFDLDGNATPGPFVMEGLQSCTVLPLAPNRLLVGTITGVERPNNNILMSALATCSQDFFVSPIKSEALDSLCQSIGLRSQTIRDELGRLGREAVDPFRDARSKSGRTGSPDMEWQLSTHDFTFMAPEVLEEFGKALSRLLSRLARFLDISLIQEIVIANDFTEAAENYNIGNDTLRGHLSNELLSGKVMSRVWIEREESLACSLFVHPSLFEALNAEDNDMSEWALYNLLDALCSVDVNTVINRDAAEYFNGMNEGSLGNDIPAALHAGLLDYIIARRLEQHGRSMAEFSEAHERDFDVALKNYNTAVEAYAPNLDSGPTDILSGIHRETERGMTVLITACRFLSTHKAEARPELGWLPILQADLDSLWRTFGYWQDDDLLINIERHFERLLWGYGIALQRDGDQLRFDHFGEGGKYSDVISYIVPLLSKDFLDQMGINVEALEEN